MPNRFNDRENGETSYFPRRRREYGRPSSERESDPQRRGWEYNENESINERGEYSPTRGVHGYESRDNEFDRRRPYDTAYAFDQDQRYSDQNQHWREDRYDYTSGQRHSQYEQGPYFGKGPKNYRRSDQRIEEDINERLTQHPFIDATHIEVRVQNGNVQLSGTVDDRNARRIAEDIVDSVSGVKELENQIRFKRKF
jgi:hypothetical protein